MCLVLKQEKKNVGNVSVTNETENKRGRQTDRERVCVCVERGGGVRGKGGLLNLKLLQTHQPDSNLQPIERKRRGEAMPGAYSGARRGVPPPS